MKGKKWCVICRDTGTEIKCNGSGCMKRYHIDCIKHSYVIKPDFNFNEFICSECGEVEENDDTCYICEDDETRGTLLMCDGCVRSVHVTCLGLSEIPPSDEWYCPFCVEAKKGGKKNRVMNAATAGKNKLGNVDICYVCQKGGRLIGCDNCIQSYHPACLRSEALEFDQDDKWQCPLCKGEDPLQNMEFKRLSRIARLEMSKKHQTQIRSISKTIGQKRDIFLWEQKSCLLPFISDKVLQKLKKSSENAKMLTNHKACNRTDNKTLNDNRLKKIEKKAVKINRTILVKGVSLKNYQRIGVSWLLDSFENKGGAILADEMGLGKTIQTLSFLSSLHCIEICGPHLIVVPLSTVGNWAREIRTFVPHLTFTKICGSKAEREYCIRDPIAWDGLYDIYITTYETVTAEETFFVDKFKWQCLILDEAHRIKNESGRIRHSMDRIDANMRILLTGTPLQNHIRELFTLLNFVFPDILQQSTMFDEAFPVNNSISKTSRSADAQQDSFINNNIIKCLSKLLNHLLLRRTKEKVVNLPRKLEKKVWLPLSPVAARWYQMLLAAAESNIETQSVRRMLGAVIKLRICCCHPTGLVSHSHRKAEIIEAIYNTSGQLVKQEAEWLSAVKGHEHLVCSSKLLFLDKLLCQLHIENLAYIITYKEDYLSRNTEQNGRIVDELKNEGMFVTFMDPAIIEDINLKEENFVVNSDSDVEGAVNEEINFDSVINIKGRRGRRFIEEHSDSQDQCATLGNDTNEIPEVIIDIQERSESNKSTGESIQKRAEEQNLMKDNSTENICDLKKRRMHKVLIFTQFQLALDEIEKYCKWRGWNYMRLDGSTNKLIRELDIREFSASESNHLVYLISTRAGGLGVNLVSANHVVLFDEDWNPFVDLQAIDRAHRIGQNRDVHVWKLVTEWTVEERMVFRREEKLMLDRVVINTAGADSSSQNTQLKDKLSLNEIKKLLNYGTEAIKLLGNSLDQWSCASRSLEFWSIDEILRREKQVLPSEFDNIDKVNGDDDEEVLISDVMNNEDSYPPIENKAIPVDSDLEDQNYSKNGKKHEIKEEKQEINLMRAKRIRRKPANIYIPECWTTTDRNLKKIQHEKICFRCAGSTKEDDALVSCFRCPKVYHFKECLGLTKEPKKTWLCPWHECSLCFRKGTESGGILIHCAECPTAFCCDCFPPEYSRYIPPNEYFEDLLKSGWNVKKSNLVLFLCSRCKALKVQQRRRGMTEQQLKDELEKQGNAVKLAREEIKSQKIAAKLDREKQKDLKKKEMDERKKFVENKKRIDHMEKEFEQRLRNAYQSLFPSYYISYVKEKRKDRSVKNCEETKDEELIRNIGGRIPQNMRAPYDVLKLCENCKFPFHDPSACIYNQELCKRYVSATTMSVRLDDSHNKESTEKNNETTEKVETNTKYVDKTNLDDPIVEKGPKLCLSDPSNVEVEEKESQNDQNKENQVMKSDTNDTQKTKLQWKSFCSKCGESSRSHYRKHCPLLTPSELQEYADRKHKMEEFISNLESKVTDISQEVEEIKSKRAEERIRVKLYRMADEIVKESLRDSGLADIIVEPCFYSSSSTQIKSNDVVKAEDDLDESSFENQKRNSLKLDDQPLKKRKMTDEALKKRSFSHIKTKSTKKMKNVNVEGTELEQPMNPDTNIAHSPEPYDQINPKPIYASKGCYESHPEVRNVDLLKSALLIRHWLRNPSLCVNSEGYEEYNCNWGQQNAVGFSHLVGKNYGSTHQDASRFKTNDDYVSRYAMYHASPKIYNCMTMDADRCVESACQPNLTNTLSSSSIENEDKIPESEKNVEIIYCD